VYGNSTGFLNAESLYHPIKTLSSLTGSCTDSITAVLNPEISLPPFVSKLT
jgi:hypothetical protein